RPRSTGCHPSSGREGRAIVMWSPEQSLHRLRALIEKLQAQRTKDGRPPWKPGDPEIWPVFATLTRHVERLTEAVEKRKRRQNAKECDRSQGIDACAGEGAERAT